ncbi:MAG: hypothetical protein MZV63_49545 [Marinilabiliales bacterium]|nr:hypothetical protein [Marinilabiliales bacterium]
MVRTICFLQTMRQISQGLPVCPTLTPYVKDGINNYIVMGQKDAVNPEKTGTKAAAHYILNIEGGESATVNLRLTKTASADKKQLGRRHQPHSEAVLIIYSKHGLRKLMSFMPQSFLLRWVLMKPT